MFPLSISSRAFDSFKENFLFDFIRSSRIDICFVHEVMTSDPLTLLSIASRWSGPCFWSPAIGRRGGVLILVSDSCNLSIASWPKDSECRIVAYLLILVLLILI